MRENFREAAEQYRQALSNYPPKYVQEVLNSGVFDYLDLTDEGREILRVHHLYQHYKSYTGEGILWVNIRCKYNELASRLTSYSREQFEMDVPPSMIGKFAGYDTIRPGKEELQELIIIRSFQISTVLIHNEVTEPMGFPIPHCICFADEPVGDSISSAATFYWYDASIEAVELFLNSFESAFQVGPRKASDDYPPQP